MSSDRMPGVPIHHVPASTQTYLGSPAIVVLSDGAHIVSLACLGTGAATHDTFVFRSDDQGRTWTLLCCLQHQIWSTLFQHCDALYLLGTDHADRYHGRLNGRIVIRRSDDKGRSWTEPRTPTTGLLTANDGYHTAPTAVVFHQGRVWKAMEFAPEPDRATWCAFVMSAAVDSDLLRKDSWSFSQRYEHLWSESQWIEGNMVVTPDGSLANLLRTNYKGADKTQETAHVDRAALVHVSDDGLKLAHDRTTGIVDFPGGGTKFTIRFDPESRLYWTLVNPQREPGVWRNVLALSSSADLHSWQIERELLRHPDSERHAYQYVDWVFDGADIIFVSRTASDDGLGGASRAHDANYITFHRIERFREK